VEVRRVGALIAIGPTSSGSRVAASPEKGVRRERGQQSPEPMWSPAITEAAGNGGLTFFLLVIPGRERSERTRNPEAPTFALGSRDHGFRARTLAVAPVHPGMTREIDALAPQDDLVKRQAGADSSSPHSTPTLHSPLASLKSAA
jgi:hypothetical protein